MERPITLAWLKQGLRAATLRPIRELPASLGAWTMLWVIVAASAIVTGASRLEVNGPVSFDVRSWLFGWAADSFLIFGIWLILNWTRKSAAHESPTAAWYLLLTIAGIPIGLCAVAIGALEARGYMPDWWLEDGWSAWSLYAAMSFWLVAAIWRVSGAVTQSRLVAGYLVTYAFVVYVLAAWQLHTEEWQVADPYRDAESQDEEPGSFELSQELFESQQALLNESLKAIAPSEGGEGRLYGLVYAPYDEDVFLRESAMVQQVLEARFGARARVVRLVNNSATATEIPWATPLNLERSLQALATAMDVEHDVLVLYLTSHGGEDFKLATWNWPLTVEELTAAGLRSMLDESGIRHRVIAVSACYSGGWIGPLQNEDTLIMTAADKDHTSYGCGSKSELTFFGRAVFDEQLRKTLSFEEAFKAAVPAIRQREMEAKKDDGFSNPQIFVGTNIRVVLDRLEDSSR